MDGALLSWKRRMKAMTNGKPIVGHYYTLDDKLYLWTDERRWHKLNTVETIELYQKQTCGDMSPQDWLKQIKGNYYD